MNVVELFIKQVEKNSLKIALVDNGKEITYLELLRRILKTASYFNSKSISKGDRVLIAIPMSIDTYRTVLALLYIGAIPVFMEEWAFKNNFYKNIKLLDCKAVIVAKKFKIIAFFSKALRTIPIKLSVSKSCDKPIDIVSLKENDTALLSFTSGSSGSPKIADRSHAFLIEQFRVLSGVTKCNGTENVCVGLAVVVLFYLAQGNTIVLRTAKLINDTQLLSNLLLKYKVNQIIDSPSKIVNYSTQLSKNITQKITNTFCGGGPVFPQDAISLNTIFSNAINTVIYGSTEVEPISVVNTSDIIKYNQQNENGLCVGEVDSNLELKIIGINNKYNHAFSEHEFSTLFVDSEQIGEIIVSGNHVLNTYFNSEEVVKKQKIKVNQTLWHRTGDSGYFKNGTLFLTGNVNALIINKNSIISPFMVENQLREIEGIYKGTIIKLNGEITIALESNLPINAIKHKIKLPFNYDKIQLIKKIPMDPRHQTKIDYNSLSVIINLKK